MTTEQTELKPKAYMFWRMADNDKVIGVTFDRPLTDDELREVQVCWNTHHTANAVTVDEIMDKAKKLAGHFINAELVTAMQVEGELRTLISQAISAQPVAVIPEGFAVVPENATPAMSAKGFCVSEAEHDPADVYDVMVQAAPPAPIQTISQTELEGLRKLSDGIKRLIDIGSLEREPVRIGIEFQFDGEPEYSIVECRGRETVHYHNGDPYGATIGAIDAAIKAQEGE